MGPSGLNVIERRDELGFDVIGVRNRNNAHLPTIRFGQLRRFGSMNGG
jgi:hypothetical protein